MSEVVIENDVFMVVQLEYEGDVVVDYFEELFDIVDIDGDLNFDVCQGCVYVFVEVEGDVFVLFFVFEMVQVLQELMCLVVQSKIGFFLCFIFDIVGLCDMCCCQLEILVDVVVVKFDEGFLQVLLFLMLSYECKLVYDIVVECGLVFEFYGEGVDCYMVLCCC